MGKPRRIDRYLIMRAGYGEEVITPPLGVELTGYGYYRERKAESVLDDLKARALFISQGGESIILISCDLLGITIDYADAVRVEISSRFEVPPQNILLACTHTHTGPAVQALPGLGEADENYPFQLSTAIVEAVEQARQDMDEAALYYHTEIAEPIGFNRRNRSFAPIDSALRILLFKRGSGSIYLLDYACHPVVLGPVAAVSADWPGALISSLESRGHRGIFFQGFCGNIDPVSNFNRWGAGTKTDLELYGKMLSSRALKAEQHAVALPQVKIKALETRQALPLSVPSRAEIEKEKEAWLEANSGNEGCRRFIENWAERAEKKFDRLKEKPYLTDIPLQTLAIGPLKIIAIPGEVFCNYGLRLQKKHPLIFTIGYANGYIGYLPTADAYRNSSDYACYIAPKFAGLFPFDACIENAILKASESLLASLDQGNPSRYSQMIRSEMQ
jgi:neutral ceramidase